MYVSSELATCFNGQRAMEGIVRRRLSTLSLRQLITRPSHRHEHQFFPSLFAILSVLSC
jgi:hypothetical protein